MQDSYLETGLNWRTIAAVMQWHAEFIADTPWQQTLCPSSSEPQIINAFKSDYVSAATAAEARISFELQPSISWLVCLVSAVHVCVFRHFKDNLRPKIGAFSAENKKNKNEKYTFGQKRKWPKPSKIVIFGAENENENEFWSVST